MKRKTVQLVVILALLAMFAQMALGSRHLSLTYDEPIYTAIGYGDLTTGDVTWHGVIGHPPLLNLLTAWPLLLESQRPDARAMPSWGTESSLGYSREVLAEFDSLERVALVTRLPVMWMTLILAALVFRWGKQLWGTNGARLSLVLFVFDPNVLAHGQLNTTDMGVVLFAFLACYLTAQYLKSVDLQSAVGTDVYNQFPLTLTLSRQGRGDKPSSLQWLRYIAVGIALGAALSSKASGLFWIGGVGLAVFVFWLASLQFGKLSKTPPHPAGADASTPLPRGERGDASIAKRMDSVNTPLRSLLLWLMLGLGWVGIAFLVLWASHLFELRPLVEGGLPIPAASHFAGLPYINDYMQSGQRVFLNGRLYENGSWLYFPVAFAVKTPLLTLVLLVATVVLAGWWLVKLGYQRLPPHPTGADARFPLPQGERGENTWRYNAVLLIAPGAYLVVAMLSALNIGHRHLLPLMPFLYVWLGQVGALTWKHKVWRHIVLAAMVLAVVVGVGVFPDYIAYFNSFAGDRGYDYLADSSVDWGQALKELKLWMDENDVPQVKLAAFTSLDPAWYGIDYEAIPPTIGAPVWLPQRFNPEPGLYAISAVPYQGIWVQDPANYDWFRHREPDAIVGGAILIYRVDASHDGNRYTMYICANPVPVLSEAQITLGLGDQPVRQLSFDCENAWQYHPGDNEYDLFILPSKVLESSWGKACSRGKLSYTQNAFWDHPAVTIVENDSQLSMSLVPYPETSLVDDPAFASPNDVVLRVGGLWGNALAEFEGPLDLIGYQVSLEEDLELWTYWIVNDVPERPLSLMAHLLRLDGTALGVADGLGIPITSWREGDVIVQRHRFGDVDVPEGAWFEVGAYWLDTVERWPVLVDGLPVADRVLVPAK